MGEIVGVALEPTPTTALSDMIDKGMSKFVTQLEEISASATKEFALLKNLRKMRDEWKDIYFECTPYRDTGVSVLASVDDIQVKTYNQNFFVYFFSLYFPPPRKIDK